MVYNTISIFISQGLRLKPGLVTAIAAVSLCSFLKKKQASAAIKQARCSKWMERQVLTGAGLALAGLPAALLALGSQQWLKGLSRA